MRPEKSYARDLRIRKLPTRDPDLVNILLAINTHLGDNESWVMSQKQLSEETRLPRRTLQRKLPVLTEHGILSSQPTKMPNGANGYSEFKIFWVKLDELIETDTSIDKPRLAAPRRQNGAADQAENLAAPRRQNGAADQAENLAAPRRQIWQRHGAKSGSATVENGAALNTVLNTQKTQEEENVVLALGSNAAEAAAPPPDTPPITLSNPKPIFDPFFQSDELKQLTADITAIYREVFPKKAVFTFGSDRTQRLNRMIAEFGAEDVMLAWRWFCKSKSAKAAFFQESQPETMIGTLLAKTQDYIEIAKQELWDLGADDRQRRATYARMEADRLKDDADRRRAEERDAEEHRQKAAGLIPETTRERLRRELNEMMAKSAAARAEAEKAREARLYVSPEKHQDNLKFLLGDAYVPPPPKPVAVHDPEYDKRELEKLRRKVAEIGMQRAQQAN